MDTHAIGGRVEACIRALVRRPGLSVVLLLAASTALGFWGLGIEIRSDMEDLFPDDTPNVVRAREARRIMKSQSELQVLVGGADRDANRRAASALAARLEARRGLIGSVEYRRDVAFFERNALLFLPLEDVQELHDEVSGAVQDAVRREMAVDDFDLDVAPSEGQGDGASKTSRIPNEAEIRERYQAEDLSEYFESPDGQVLAIKAYPTFKPADTKRTTELMKAVEHDIEVVRAFHRADGITVTVEGDYTQVTAAVDQIKVDLGRASGAALLIIALVLTLHFRRLRAVLLVLVPLLAGLAVTAAFARISIGYLNLITAFIFAILLGLGIDFAVHAASRIDEEYAAGIPLEQALPRALRRLGRAMVAAAVTTMATFAALTVFDFRGFSQFGLIAAGGVALCLAAVYLIIPPLAASLHRLRARPPVHKPDRVGDTKPMSRGLAIATVVAVVAAVALAASGLGRLEFEADLGKLRPKVARTSSELRQKYRDEAETRNASPALIITEGVNETRRVHRHMEKLAHSTELLDEVVSIITFVPERQDEKLALIAEMKRKIDNKYGILEPGDQKDADEIRPYLEPSAYTVEDLPDWVLDKFTDSSGTLGRYVLLYVTGSRSRADHVLRIQDAVGRTEIDGRAYHATASWMILGDAYTTVRREGPWAVGFAALVVFLLLAIDLRRLRWIALAFLPLAAGFVLFLGILAWAEIPLNLFNVVVLPTILGIGVDTSIHLVHRLRAGEPVRRVLRTAGAAAGISSLTTAIGFGSLLVVANEGLRSIGWVAVVGIICCYLTSTLLTASIVTLARSGGQHAS